MTTLKDVHVNLASRVHVLQDLRSREGLYAQGHTSGVGFVQEILVYEAHSQVYVHTCHHTKTGSQKQEHSSCGQKPGGSVASRYEQKPKKGS